MFNIDEIQYMIFLSSCLSYSNFITMYYNGKSNDLLNNNNWNNCNIIHKFLKHFCSTTKNLFGQYYPINSRLLLNLFKITTIFASVDIPF